MAVTWKKVLSSGQVVSADLASEGSSGQFLTTNGSGTLSYTSGTGAHGCPDTSASPTFTGTVQGATLKATTKVETDSIQAPQSTDLEILSDYQSSQVVDVNGVVFYGSATPAVQVNKNIGAGIITCSTVQMADDGEIQIGTGDDMKLYHDGTDSYLTNASGAMKVATETSGIAVTIGHTTSETTIGDNLTVTGTVTSGAITASGTVSADGNLTATGDCTASSGEGSFGTLAVGANATVTGDLTVSGDLLVSGDTVEVNVSSILVEDDAINLLHNVGNDTTDSGIVFGMDTATRQAVVGHDASAQRVVIAGGISAGALSDIEGFVATINCPTDEIPDSADPASGIGSFWLDQNTDNLYIRVE